VQAIIPRNQTRLMMQTVWRATLLASFTATVACMHGVRIKKHRFLSHAYRLEPEIVAHTLISVEEKWKVQATSFARCNMSNTSMTTECAAVAKAFKKSCGTIAQAVLRASNGDQMNVREYFDDICGQRELASWAQERCRAFANFMSSAMIHDDFYNRERFDARHVCNSFWKDFQAHLQHRAETSSIEQVGGGNEAKPAVRKAAVGGEPQAASHQEHNEQTEAAAQNVSVDEAKAALKAMDAANAAVEESSVLEEQTSRMINSTEEDGMNLVSNTTNKTPGEHKLVADMRNPPRVSIAAAVASSAVDQNDTVANVTAQSSTAVA